MHSYHYTEKRKKNTVNVFHYVSPHQNNVAMWISATWTMNANWNDGKQCDSETADFHSRWINEKSPHLYSHTCSHNTVSPYILWYGGENFKIDNETQLNHNKNRIQYNAFSINANTTSSRLWMNEQQRQQFNHGIRSYCNTVLVQFERIQSTTKKTEAKQQQNVSRI